MNDEHELASRYALLEKVFIIPYSAFIDSPRQAPFKSCLNIGA